MLTVHSPTDEYSLLYVSGISDTDEVFFLAFPSQLPPSADLLVEFLSHSCHYETFALLEPNSLKTFEAFAR